jgi:tRNA threonylcarbamoyladenosine biosynthesis protein TsaE
VTTSRQEARGQRRDPLPSHELRVTLAELTTWGEELGRRVSPGSIIALQGELGTGKTTLAQAICRGVGIREDVTSPTFALVNEYHVNGSSLFHLDLYRLAGPADLTNIAWDDIINSGAIVIIEWPERAGDRMPDEAVHIRLDYIPGDESRRALTVG